MKQFNLLLNWRSFILIFLLIFLFTHFSFSQNQDYFSNLEHERKIKELLYLAITGLLSIMLFYLGFKLTTKSKKINNELLKTEFKKRNNSGVLEFENLEDSQEHNRLWGVVYRQAHFGVWLKGAGIVAAVLFLLLVWSRNL